MCVEVWMKIDELMKDKGLDILSINETKRKIEVEPSNADPSKLIDLALIRANGDVAMRIRPRYVQTAREAGGVWADVRDISEMGQKRWDSNIRRRRKDKGMIGFIIVDDRLRGELWIRECTVASKLIQTTSYWKVVSEKKKVWMDLLSPKANYRVQRKNILKDKLKDTESTHKDAIMKAKECVKRRKNTVADDKLTATECMIYDGNESEITMDEVMKELKLMKVGKAPGYDRLSSEMLRRDWATGAPRLGGIVRWTPPASESSAAGGDNGCAGDNAARPGEAPCVSPRSSVSTFFFNVLSARERAPARKRRRAGQNIKIPPTAFKHKN
ncbi:hypothetical protein EVAR_42056_1 [Eumeta japonica]|uniref:Uncharacterized protein n=1 Tax=Eumeta variegata TaxID=151549 RepID=A0A4C1XY41_EUMVA|nr:hypothetical protein EVAR_42056_1 [Eumeta japonica]